MLLSQATKGWDALDVAPCAREELDASWDDSRLTDEDRTWLAEIQSLTALPDVEPEADPRVVDTKRRIKEMLTLVDRWLKGDAESPLTQRDACRLYAEARAQQKRLAKLGTPKRRGTHDYSSLSLPELQRLARIDDIARGRTQPTS
jgi:hypothetical protein